MDAIIPVLPFSINNVVQNNLEIEKISIFRQFWRREKTEVWTLWSNIIPIYILQYALSGALSQINRFEVKIFCDC